MRRISQDDPRTALVSNELIASHLFPSSGDNRDGTIHSIHGLLQSSPSTRKSPVSISGDETRQHRLPSRSLRRSEDKSTVAHRTLVAEGVICPSVAKGAES